MEEQKKEIADVINEKIEVLNNNGISLQNLDTLYKLVDIKKDLLKIKKMEEEDMYSRRYGARGRGSNARRDSMGRYANGRMDEMIDRFNEGYNEYNDGRMEYRESGNYRAKEETHEALEYMLESVVNFVEMLQDDADSQEEVELIKKYVRKIKEI